MQVGQGVISDMAFIEVTPCFISDDRSNDTLSPWKPWPLSPSHPMSLDPHSPLSRRVRALESLAVLPCPSAQIDPNLRQGGNGHMMPINHALGQDTRKTSVLLDTRQWSQPPSFVAPYALPGSHLGLVDTRSHASLPCLAGGSNDFTDPFSFNGPPAPDIGPNSQVTLHTQPAPNLSPDFSGLMGYHHENVGTNLGYPTLPGNSMMVSSSSSCSIRDHASILSDGRQPPVMLYYPPAKKGSGRRRYKRASAINIEGLWIDKDDLYTIPGEGSSMIRVHECQWDKSGKPCGMWIIASRACVGAHVRKWHRHTHADGRCLWDRCAAKAMLKDSINRHVVTIHLGEGFHCLGCHQEFPRKDVYDQHVQKGEQCKDAGAVMVYGTECRVIDTRKALQQGGAVRYAD